MTIKCFIENQTKIQAKLLQFLDTDDDIEEKYSNLFNFIKDHGITKDNHNLRLFLYLIGKIAKNHYRSQNFNYKLAKVFQNIRKEIKQFFSNFEIFSFFKNNKLIIQILVDNNTIQIDQQIQCVMLKDKYIKSKYPEYFYLQKEDLPNDEFRKKRLIGVNDLLICELIRDDKIEEFIDYVTKTKFPLNSIIKISIFETNQLLLKKEPTLIEYCAFYGSINILKFLFDNAVKCTPSLWKYAIHGNNKQILDILIEKEIKPNDESYEKCFEESIKCHNIDITNYIQANLISEKDEANNIKKCYNRNSYYYCLRYHNYMHIPSNVNNKFIFFYFCEFDYYKLVEYFVKTKKIDINSTVVKEKHF